MGEAVKEWQAREVANIVRGTEHEAKKHCWMEYQFAGKAGRRIVREDGANSSGEKLYHDYKLGKSGTESQLKRWIGARELSIGGAIDLSQVKIIPVRAARKEKREEGGLTVGQLQKNSSQLFEYYRSLGKEGLKQCAGFSFGYAVPAILEREGQAMPLHAVSTWDLKGYLPKTLFSEESFFGKGEEAQRATGRLGNGGSEANYKFTELDEGQKERVRKMLIDAPAGAFVAVRYRFTETRQIREDPTQPSHTIVSLGNGVWAENMGGAFISRDIKNDEDFRNFLALNVLVENSRLYVPRKGMLPKAEIREFSERGITPEKFAVDVSRRLGVPFEYAMGEIARQNNITGGFRSRKEELKVTLAAPKYSSEREESVAPEWTMDMKTPAMEKRTQVKAAGMVPLADPIVGRRNAFVEKIRDLQPAMRAYGIPKESADALACIMYNEYYASEDTSLPTLVGMSRRGVAEKLAGTMNMAAGVIGKEAVEIKTIGVFQSSVAAARKFLDNAENRELFSAALGRLGYNDNKLVNALEEWSGLGSKEKEGIVRSRILDEPQLALFFAYENYKGNQQNVKEKIGKANVPYEDMEMTGMWAHNVGLPRVYNAIFQQNLLMAAEEAGIRAEGVRIDGLLRGKGQASKTLDIFKAVCNAKGISEIEYADKGERKTAKVADLDAKAFSGIFGTYKNAAEFFNRGEFKQGGFEFKPCLDYSYLSNRQELVTNYVKNYLFFIRTAQVQSEYAGRAGAFDRAGMIWREHNL